MDDDTENTPQKTGGLFGAIERAFPGVSKNQFERHSLELLKRFDKLEKAIQSLIVKIDRKNRMETEAALEGKQSAPGEPERQAEDEIGLEEEEDDQKQTSRLKSMLAAGVVSFITIFITKLVTGTRSLFGLPEVQEIQDADQLDLDETSGQLGKTAQSISDLNDNVQNTKGLGSAIADETSPEALEKQNADATKSLEDTLDSIFGFFKDEKDAEEGREGDVEKEGDVQQTSAEEQPDPTFEAAPTPTPAAPQPEQPQSAQQPKAPPPPPPLRPGSPVKTGEPAPSSAPSPQGTGAPSKTDSRPTPGSGSVPPGYGKLLSFIAKGEGGYNSMNQGTSGGQIIGSTHNASRILGKNLTDMTIGEVKEAQSRPRGDPRRLFAAGRYQIIPQTMADAIKGAGSGITDNTLFDAKTQDRLGMGLLVGGKRPNLSKYLKGSSNNIRAAMVDFALEWASIPHPDTGRSAYGSGNKSSHTVEEVRQALLAAKAIGPASGPSAPTGSPVPGQVATGSQVAQSSQQLQAGRQQGPAPKVVTVDASKAQTTTAPPKKDPRQPVFLSARNPDPSLRKASDAAVKETAVRA